MVGIVIIAHSHELAQGVRETALQMCGNRRVAITAAGGLEDDSLGTSFEKIEQALLQASSADGTLVLMDLGSAVMTAQMVVESLPPEKQARIRLCGAPLVEGAIAAAAAAAAGLNLAEVQRAAERVLSEIPKIDRPVQKEADIPCRPEAALEITLPALSVEVRLPNRDGLHARPAMQLVKAASRFRSRITLQNLTRQRNPVDAKMPMQVAFGGTARQGEKIRIQAVGEDAEQALASLLALVESGFGELEPFATAASRKQIPPGRQKEGQKARPPSGRLQGIGAAEGFAVAPAFLYRPETVQHPPGEPSALVSPQAEISRLRQALAEAGKQLENLQFQTGHKLDEKSGWIFEFHRMMLEDAQFVAHMEAEIRSKHYTAVAALRSGFAIWKEKAAGLDAIMQSRAVDLQDVENRLVRILSGGDPGEGPVLKHPAIMVAEDLAPSDLARMDRSFMEGIVCASGSTVSHTSILARTWGIPAVMGLGEIILALTDGTRLALDGSQGVVEVDPSPETTAAYLKHAERLAQSRIEMLDDAHQAAVTRDGKRIPVLANAADPASVKEALRQGAEGIGLLRTEFLFLNRSTMPDEEEQYRVYRRIVKDAGEKPVIMRTLDIGGDKRLPFIDPGPEPNPALGLRAIRLCLKRPDIFQPQLRAMLRAGQYGNLKILFPMITTLEEVSRAKAALAAARDSLIRDGLDHAGSIEVGIMIETPAAALKADTLAQEVDFFSIGSNDLAQYTLACDRDNSNLAHLLDPWDPAVLALVRRIIECAHNARKRVAMCGEFAGQLKAIPFLLGLGLEEFSVPVRQVPAVKHRIRQLDSRTCRADAERYLQKKIESGSQV